MPLWVLGSLRCNPFHRLSSQADVRSPIFALYRRGCLLQMIAIPNGLTFEVQAIGRASENSPGAFHHRLLDEALGLSCLAPQTQYFSLSLVLSRQRGVSKNADLLCSQAFPHCHLKHLIDAYAT